jgi:hypothetical protein
MPRDAAEAGGGTREAGAAVVDAVVVELVVGATLTEEVEPSVPVVDERGGVTAPAAGGDRELAEVESELETAVLVEAAAVVEVVLPKAATGATAGVLLESCLFVLPWVNLMFLGNLRMLSSITTRASTGAGSDRGTAISRWLTLMGRAAALVTAIARRTKEVA